MHEISLIRNMFETLEEEFPGRLSQVRNVRLSVGWLSNLQPILLQSAFEAVLVDEPRYRHISLDVEVLPIMIKCEHCGLTTEVVDYTFICPCGQPCNQIVQGDELMISQVSFENEPVNQPVNEIP
jgi:hydrogenase nickel incorporation protein HypA/HybF